MNKLLVLYENDLKIDYWAFESYVKAVRLGWVNPYEIKYTAEKLRLSEDLVLYFLENYNRLLKAFKLMHKQY